MKNPWTKKNPFMSMWLSGANSVANRARGQATAVARKEAASIAARGVGDAVDFWVAAAAAAGNPAGAGKATKTRRTKK